MDRGEQMELFRSERTDVCPICEDPLSTIPSIIEHCATHVIRVEESGTGYMWQCGCGERDGIWYEKVPAIASLSLHMHERHRIAI
jgi:hypothetical protein